MLGILCGLEAEAVIARRVKGAIVACAAARPGLARGLARDLVKQGATRLVSFGISGGLDAALPLGALVLATKVVSPNGAWDCDAAWGDGLAKKLPHAIRGAEWGSETLVGKAAEKQADMESQCAAEIAAEFKLPLMVVRTVCDNANMDVPEIVMHMIGEDGSLDYMKAVRHVLCHPSQIPDLIHVGAGTGKALGALKGTVEALAA